MWKLLIRLDLIREYKLVNAWVNTRPEHLVVTGACLKRLSLTLRINQ